MRNSNTMANAPTASTANIVGCYPTVEPIYKNLYVKSNMAGDFMVVNEFLVEDLKKLGLWNADMLERIKYHDGSIQSINEIPQVLRDKYKEAFEIEPQWLVKAAAWRGRWIDQSQSLNIFYGGTSGKVLSDIYQYAWSLGLKTTYYLRTMGASRIEKSTVNMAKFGSTSQADAAVSNGQPVASNVTIEETIAVLPRQAHEEPAMMAPSSVMAAAPVGESTPSPIKVAQTVIAAASIPEAPKGIPTFGGVSTVVQNRPKIEIIGEACESCSA